MAITFPMPTSAKSLGKLMPLTPFSFHCWPQDSEDQENKQCLDTTAMQMSVCRSSLTKNFSELCSSWSLFVSDLCSQQGLKTILSEGSWRVCGNLRLLTTHLTNSFLLASGPKASNTAAREMGTCTVNQRMLRASVIKTNLHFTPACS